MDSIPVDSCQISPLLDYLSRHVRTRVISSLFTRSNNARALLLQPKWCASFISSHYRFFRLFYYILSVVLIYTPRCRRQSKSLQSCPRTQHSQILTFFQIPFSQPMVAAQPTSGLHTCIQLFRERLNKTVRGNAERYYG